MRITKSVYDAVKSSIGSMRPEEGGMLLSSDGGRTVNGFVYDDRGSKTGSAYSPNVDFINEQIKKNRRRGSYFVGMIHSHPRGCTSLSMGRGRGYGYTVSDEDAIHKLMGCMKGTAKLYFPVVQSSDSGSFSMRAFAAIRRQNGTLAITEEPIEIVPDVENEWAREGICKALGCDKHYGKSIIMIGVEGEREVAEELTRQGVSSFVLVDAARMDDNAIGEGAGYFEIGTYAADSVLRSIHQVNPFASVKLLRDSVDAQTELDTFYDWLSEINIENAVALIGTRLAKNAKRSAIARLKRLGIPTVEAAVKEDSVEAFITLADNKESFRSESAYINSTLGASVIRAVLCEVKVRAAMKAFSLTASAPEVTDTQTESTPAVTRRAPIDKWDSLYKRETIEKKLVVIVGCGGSRSYAENLARSGIKHFVLIDGDKYSATNVQTQTSYLSELGRNKAEVIGERIRLIAPDADIKIIPRMLDEHISDERFETWVGEKLKRSPSDVLIAACTDNFHAQARCSRLALKYGTPFIQAGIYTGGRVLELIFFHPAASTVCPRCMLEGRYRANLEAKEKPAPAQSHGTSVFFTEELNAKKGFISLALLLYREPDADERYSAFVDDNKWVTHGGKHATDRNFMYFTMDSDLEHHTGRSAWAQFDKWGKMLGSNYQLGVCLFRKKQPRKDCPDCRGIGDLSKIRGKIHDTRSGIYTI